MSFLASHRSNAEIPAGVNARRDYNAEGRRLVEALGLQVGGNYNAMDAIWKESSTGGKIYVGNETAARGPASTLAEHGITHVVNCTDDMANFCEGALLRAAEPTCCRRAAQNTILCPPPRPPKPTRRSQSTCQPTMHHFSCACPGAPGLSYLRFNAAYWQSAGVMQAGRTQPQ